MDSFLMHPFGNWGGRRACHVLSWTVLYGAILETGGERRTCHVLS